MIGVNGAGFNIVVVLRVTPSSRFICRFDEIGEERTDSISSACSKVIGVEIPQELVEDVITDGECRLRMSADLAT